VVVHNDNWSDVVVYLGSTNRGVPTRLGRVGSSSTDTLRIRVLPISDLFLELTYTTRGPIIWVSESLFWVQPGDCVELGVQVVVNMSTVHACFS
jgi:hypothetical protein